MEIERYITIWNASGSNSLLTGAFLFIKETPTLLGDYM
jgi:hypothetical protein